MRLNKVFEKVMKEANLKRIRLKSDPANNQLPYEGYILREFEDGSMEIFVADAPVQYQTVTPNAIDICASLQPIDKLKLTIIGCIKDDDRCLCASIKDLNTISDIENMLISNGYTFEDLYLMMKKYFAIT